MKANYFRRVWVLRLPCFWVGGRSGRPRSGTVIRKGISNARRPIFRPLFVLLSTSWFWTSRSFGSFKKFCACFFTVKGSPNVTTFVRGSASLLGASPRRSRTGRWTCHRAEFRLRRVSQLERQRSAAPQRKRARANTVGQENTVVRKRDRSWRIRDAAGLSGRHLPVARLYAA